MIDDQTKICPFCGESIKAVAIKCRFCGEDLTEQLEENSSQQSAQLKPHRGEKLIAFAVVSLLSTLLCFSAFTFIFPFMKECLSFSILIAVAVNVMANKDLQKIKSGQMDRSGEGLTQSAKILVLIVMILNAFNFLYYVWMYVVIVATW